MRPGRNQTRRVRRGCRYPRWVGRLAAPALALTLIALGILGGNQLRKFLTTSPVFAVQQVLVSGNDRVSGAEIVRVMDISPGTNLFKVDLKRVGERVRRIRWIREVSLHRQLPDTLRIKVEERKPFALVQGRSLYLVDREGAVLEEGVPAGRYRLPVVLAAGEPVEIGEGRIQDEDLVSALSIVSQIEHADLIEDPFSITLMPKDRVVMRIQGRPEEVWLQGDAVAEELTKLKALHLLRRRNAPRQYIDLTYAGMVVTK